MSLHQLANHMSAQGRGPDSTLVHMSPREVSGLQSLAMAHGGTLTINPETGLPEAGFLDSLMPTLLGGAATFFSGGAITPFMAALGVGGLTALTSKDLGKGLMAGLGAYGGAGIAGGLMNFGEAAIGAEAAKGALPSGIDPVGADAGAYEMGQAAAAKTARAGATNFDRLSRGVTEGFKNPMGALSAVGDGSKLKGAAMFAGPAMAAFSAVDEPKTSIPEKSKTAFIRSFYKDPVTGQKMANPAIPAEDFGNRTLGEQYFAANGGLIALAGGGQTAYDYLDRKRSTSSDAGIVVDDTPPKPRLPPLGSDGKGSYTYNKDSKTWVWTPTAKPVVPVNPGVATLMDTGGPGGGQDRAFDPGPGGGYGIPGATMVGGISGPTTGLASGANSLAAYLGNLNAGKGISGAISDTLAKNIDPSFSHEGRTGRGTGSTTVTDSEGKQVTVDKSSLGSFTIGPNGLTALTGPTTTAGSYADPGAVTSDDRENAKEGISGLTTSSGTLDNLGDRPQSNPTASLPTVGYTGTGLSLLSDFLTGSPTSLTTAPVETREATLSPAAAAAASDAAQAAKDNADNPTNDNPMGGDVTSSTPDGPSGAPTGNGDVAEGGGGNYGDSSPDSIANGGMVGRYAQGGLGSLGGYSDGGRLLRGPGDGVSDSIPATVGDRQPARLADGEFVVPARIVSELGNGSTEAGARALYKMMDRIQANRRKTTGKNRVAVNSKSHKYLPA